MAKKIYLTDRDIEEFLHNTQTQLIEECDRLKKRKLNANQFEDLALNFSFNNCNDKRKASITFSEKAWLKINALIYSFSTEVEWHGVVERLSVNSFLINDIIVFPHEVTRTTVVSDQIEYENWLDTLDIDTFNALRFHGHSHVDMGVTPSSVDMTYRSNLLNMFNTPSPTPNYYYIFLIFNKKGEISGEIYDLEYNALYSTGEITFRVANCAWLTEFLAEAKNIVVEQKFNNKTFSNAPTTISSHKGKQSSSPIKNSAKHMARYNRVDDTDDLYYDNNFDIIYKQKYNGGR